MRIHKFAAALAIAAGLAFIAAPAARAQVSLSFGVNVGPQPICPYGYFDYAPYNCAPYGYYGPAWFPNGFFIGAGPWFRGPRGFYGRVNNRFDPRHGYRGPYPHRGDRDRFRGYGHGHGRFHGNERRGGYDRGRDNRGDRDNRGGHRDRGNHGRPH